MVATSRSCPNPYRGAAGSRPMRTSRSARAAAQIAHMARHDALTGLANREQFLEYLQATAQRDAACFAVLLIDLDSSRRSTIRSDIRSAMHCSRPWLSGLANRWARGHRRPFGRRRVCDSAAARRRSCRRASSRLLTHIREPYQIEGREVKIGLSIGIATGQRRNARAERDHAQRRPRALPGQGRRA